MSWEKRWFQYAILLFLAFIWGSSFILMKIGLRSFSSPQAASIRIIAAFAILLPVSVKNLRSINKADIKYLLIAGFVGSFIPAFLFTKAQTRIDSALAGMLNSLTPIFTLIVGVLFFQSKGTWLQLVGLIFGFAGAAGLIITGEEVSLSNINVYGFFILLATVCYAFNINVVKRHLTHLTGAQITSISFLFIGPAAIIALISSDLTQITMQTNWTYHLIALLTLGILGTAFAMLIMNSLIRYASAVFASSVTYIIPVFAIFWGLLDGETITLFHFIFIAFILTGVYIINTRKTPGIKKQNDKEIDIE